MLMRNIFLVALTVLGVISCVSKSKHQDEVRKYEDELRAKNEENQKKSEELSRLTKETNDLQQKLVATTKDRGQLKDSLQDLNKAIAEMRERQAQERKTIQDYKELTARFKNLTDSGALSVHIKSGKMMVSLGSDILFASGSASLSESGKGTIKEIAKKLSEIPGKSYQVEGHTDNIPIKTAMFHSNWELASARAIAVVRTLIDGGMPENRVSAASYADTMPETGNDTPEMRARNRRIEIVVIPDLSQLPGYEELKKLSSSNDVAQ